MWKAIGLAAGLAMAMAAAGPSRSATENHALPGIAYQVLAKGPADGAPPLRGDQVSLRYVGRLADGEVFSASPRDGAEPMAFKVRELIPGMSAAVQLMRPGDRWRVSIPSYLAYGRLGRAAVPPQARRSIPPNAALVFEVELVGVAPAAAP
jgi:FKBP-type peptidyl-prolyl cis-trans isomerase FklB